MLPPAKSSPENLDFHTILIERLFDPALLWNEPQNALQALSKMIHKYLFDERKMEDKKAFNFLRNLITFVYIAQPRFKI